MTTKEKNLLQTIRERRRQGSGSPIFVLMVFENADRAYVDENGVSHDIPDLGWGNRAGFYDALCDAIEAMNQNLMNNNGQFKAGFILCLFPGIFDEADTNQRIYFLWDDEKKGYFEHEEPAIFANQKYGL